MVSSLLGAIIGDIVGSKYEFTSNKTKDFEDTVRNAVSLGGDSDTQAAMAGAIAEAFYGIPEDIKQKGLEYIKGAARGYLQFANNTKKGRRKCLTVRTAPDVQV